MKFPLKLKYFLIGFAHIFVSNIAFALMLNFDGIILAGIFMLAILATVTYLLYRIAKANNTNKWIWFVIVGFIISLAWVSFELASRFFVLIRVIDLIPMRMEHPMALLGLIIFCIPATFIVIILECVIAQILAKRKIGKESSLCT